MVEQRAELNMMYQDERSNSLDSESSRGQVEPPERWSLVTEAPAFIRGGRFLQPRIRAYTLKSSRPSQPKMLTKPTRESIVLSMPHPHFANYCSPETYDTIYHSYDEELHMLTWHFFW
jgi:hypothetical protein